MKPSNCVLTPIDDVFLYTKPEASTFRQTASTGEDLKYYCLGNLGLGESFQFGTESETGTKVSIAIIITSSPSSQVRLAALFSPSRSV